MANINSTYSQNNFNLHNFQVSQNHLRNYNKHWVSPNSLLNNPYGIEIEKKLHNVRLDNHKSFPIMSGDYGADTPSQSNFDNYIVSVQNTSQMCQSTRKHIAEQQQMG